MARREFVAAPELRVEPPHRAFVETGRLRHQVVAGGEVWYPLAAARRAEAAEHELRIEAVAAFLEGKAVGNLRVDGVGGPHRAWGPRVPGGGMGRFIALRRAREMH